MFAEPAKSDGGVVKENKESTHKDVVVEDSTRGLPPEKAEDGIVKEENKGSTHKDVVVEDSTKGLPPEKAEEADFEVEEQTENLLEDTAGEKAPEKEPPDGLPPELSLEIKTETNFDNDGTQSSKRSKISRLSYAHIKRAHINPKQIGSFEGHESYGGETDRHEIYRLRAKLHRFYEQQACRYTERCARKKQAREEEESLLCAVCGRCCQPNDYCCDVNPGRQILHDELTKLVKRIKCKVINPELALQHLQALTASRVVGPEITPEHIGMLKGSIAKRFADRVLAWQDLNAHRGGLYHVYDDGGDIRRRIHSVEDAIASAAEMRRQVLTDCPVEPTPRPTEAQSSLHELRQHLDHLQEGTWKCPAASSSHFPHLSVASVETGTSGLLRGAQLGAQSSTLQY